MTFYYLLCNEIQENIDYMMHIFHNRENIKTAVKIQDLII